MLFPSSEFCHPEFFYVLYYMWTWQTQDISQFCFFVVVLVHDFLGVLACVAWLSGEGEGRGSSPSPHSPPRPCARARSSPPSPSPESQAAQAIGNRNYDRN